MEKFKKFTQETLENAHTDIIREIGRRIGVKAPTTKKKEQIIAEIIAIQKGELEAVELSKRGAPVKIAVDISAYLVKDDWDNISYDYTPYEDIILNEEDFDIDGIFEPHLKYGFIRVKNYSASDGDAFVSQEMIAKLRLRPGDRVTGYAKPVRETGSAALQSVYAINGYPVDSMLHRKKFDDFTACHPNKRIKLESETKDSSLSMRAIDLLCPLGFGQRGLIVAPPKTGKTTLLKMVAKSIEENYPKAKLIVLLIDERPEEVTDIKSSIKGEVVYSTFDKSAEHHVKIAELVINRAKRLVEIGEDVIVLMDSITRLTRAYNTKVESSGKTLSGGIDPAALEGPKSFFCSARNTFESGSLTILSTALIETGSRMDDVIYEEFKGRGNMEIHLSRELSEKRIFPAIDFYKSGTREEQRLLNDEELSASYKLRRVLSESEDSTENLLEMMKKTKNNQDLIEKLDDWLRIYGK